METICDETMIECLDLQVYQSHTYRMGHFHVTSLGEGTGRVGVECQHAAFNTLVFGPSLPNDTETGF